MLGLVWNSRRDLGDRPVLQPSCQVKVSAVVEAPSAQEFLQRQTRMLKHLFPRRLMRIKAIFLDLAHRIPVDLVNVIVVGLIDAVCGQSADDTEFNLMRLTEFYGCDLLHMFSWSERSSSSSSVDDAQEDVLVDGHEAQRAQYRQ